MSKHETPTERAIALLKLHGGRCSVPKPSDLHEAFTEMWVKGEVYLSASPTAGMVDVEATLKSDYKNR